MLDSIFHDIRIILLRFRCENVSILLKIHDVVTSVNT